MLLAIDAGNTRTKWAVFETNVLVEGGGIHKDEFQYSLTTILQKYPLLQHAIFPSVSHLDAGELKFLENSLQVVVVDRKAPFPFKNLYQTPETLGIDRMILASAAVLKYPSVHRLVIDAGTCITYDYVDNQDQYYGGAISPGLQMRYNAMHQFTAKLPQLELAEQVPLVGQDTAHAMHSGVVHGVVGEIEYMIQNILADKENFTIILTGGDAEFLAKRLKSIIFAHSNFLLEGLNHYFYFLQSHA
ncbi:MAG: type III pantothenate kinase [Flavobacterium sp.]